MINSYSYKTHNLVFIKFQIFDQDLSWCLTSTKDLNSSFEAITCWFKSSCYKIASSTRDRVLAFWIVFGSSHLGEENRQEDFGLALFV